MTTPTSRPVTEATIRSPKDTPAIAASLARYGFQIFPVRLTVLTAPDGTEKRIKIPLIKGWTTGAASNDPTDIWEWFSEKHPTAFIGVFAGGSDVIAVDLDISESKNGFAALEANKIELPATLHYKTLSGGEHHIYGAPDGRWTLGADVQSPGGEKMRGVDIRAGGSYFVYYGSALRERPALADAPPFALIPARSSSVSHDLGLAEWKRLLPQTPSSRAVSAALGDVRPTGMSHQDMLSVTGLLVKLGSECHGGVADALDQGRAIYADGWGRHYDAQWDHAVAGSVLRWGPPRNSDFEFDASKENLGPRMEPPTWDAEAFRPDDAFVQNDRGHGQRLDPELLRRVVDPHGDLILGVDERIWRYDTGRYVPDDDAPTRRAVQVLRNRYQKISGPLVRDMVVHRPGFPRLTDDAPDPGLINVRNGMFHWRDQEILPHSPSYGSLVQLPLTYDPMATCPVFDEWLAQVFDADMAPVAWEVIAYALMPGNPFQKVALLVGPPHSGKGTFLRVLERMLGEANVAHVTPQAMNDRWAPATLYGKLANIVGDASSREVVDTARFKMIVGGDRILADRKNKELFEFTPWCFHVIAANQLIGSDDPSGGWARRWLPIPFARTVPIDPTFKESRLYEEIPGIFNRAVSFLPGLIARKRFTETMSMIEPLAEIRTLSDAVSLWLSEDGGVTSDPGDPTIRENRTTLYGRYRTWAASSGNEPTLPAQEVYKRLRSLGYDERKSGNDRFFLGFKINPTIDVLSSFRGPALA